MLAPLLQLVLGLACGALGAAVLIGIIEGVQYLWRRRFLSRPSKCVLCGHEDLGRTMLFAYTDRPMCREEQPCFERAVARARAELGLDEPKSGTAGRPGTVTVDKVS